MDQLTTPHIKVDFFFKIWLITFLENVIESIFKGENRNQRQQVCYAIIIQYCVIILYDLACGLAAQWKCQNRNTEKFIEEMLSLCCTTPHSS